LGEIGGKIKISSTESPVRNLQLSAPNFLNHYDAGET